MIIDKFKLSILLTCIATTILLVLICTVLPDDPVERRDSIFSLGALAAATMLLGFQHEARLIRHMHPMARIPWRIFLSLCFIILAICFSQLRLPQAIYHQTLACFQKSNCPEFWRIFAISNNPGPAPQNALVNNFNLAWIGLIGIIIAGLIKYLRDLAKGHDLQIDELSDEVDHAILLNKISTLYFNLHALFNDLDIEDYHNERDGLLLIRSMVSACDELFSPLADLHGIHQKLQGGLMKLNNIAAVTEPPLDQRYIKFFAIWLCPLLEALHARLMQIEYLTLSESGRLCVDEVAAFWRFAREA